MHLKSLASVPVADTTKPGPLLQDTYILGSAYYQSTPPDLINCAWYAARAAAFAPEPYKSQMMPLAKYCFKKYHGADDGFDALVAAAQRVWIHRPVSRSSLHLSRRILWRR